MGRLLGGLALALWLLLGQGAVMGNELGPASISPRQEAEMAIQRWFEPAEWTTAWCVAWRESGFQPNAVGPAGERGIMQIHPIHFWAYDADRLFDIDYNIAVAHDMWTGSGWQPWSAWPLCRGW